MISAHTSTHTNSCANLNSHHPRTQAALAEACQVTASDVIITEVVAFAENTKILTGNIRVLQHRDPLLQVARYRL